MAYSSNYIQFINHASVIIRGNNKSVLTDPWYWGSAFNEGWKLLYENSDVNIRNILQKTNYIWISHEHPDHFSIPFFKAFNKIISDLGIEILFQKTKDSRVSNFLRNLGLFVQELESNHPYELEDGFSVKIIKDEFYDSALIANVNGCTIFNINDCPLHEKSRIEKFRDTYGTCDILLTQFSYAAWKGGVKNLRWRQAAAKDKLSSLLQQGKIFEAKIVIPFASFFWFSNSKNFYLNDSINKPLDVLNYCLENQASFKVVFLAPLEKLVTHMPVENGVQNLSSLEFWDHAYREVSQSDALSFLASTQFDQLQDQFIRFRRRILKNNSLWLIWFLSKIPSLDAFKQISIYLDDLEISVLVDLLRGKFVITKIEPEISMHSASLAYIFNNPFGFDTLTVNGCFDENQPGGFSKFSKIFALENLNNLGIYLKLSIIFNIDVILIFMRRLMKVRLKMQGV